MNNILLNLSDKAIESLSDWHDTIQADENSLSLVGIEAGAPVQDKTESISGITAAGYGNLDEDGSWSAIESPTLEINLNEKDKTLERNSDNKLRWPSLQTSAEIKKSAEHL